MLEVPVLVLSLLLGLVYFRFLGNRASHGRAALKAAPVLLLAVYAAIAGGPTWLVMALFLGALGDLCLAYDGARAFIAGLVSFLLSHIAYVALFWPMAEPSLILGEAWRIGSAAALAILVPALILVLWRPAGPLAMPVAIYGLVIGAMGFTALSVADAAIFVGAALFLSSDTALAAEKFLVGAAATPGRLLRNFVWATYYSAQLVFTLAVAGLPSA
ncbi:lysoplasmalogenase [Pseudorhizobium flavum]|uniref:lysoplasmalogenase n=1 Tax=Pseudorhizobium flavum TaxID=1335061 RepID=UPI002491BD1D|nr:lysoplasmalogenase [Pseudorhizobium flavum]